jgi:hypothetical protein
MPNTIQALRNEEMILKNPSKLFEVPRSILKIIVNSGGTDIDILINNRLVRKPVLPNYLEEEFVGYCLTMERKFLGLTRMSIKRLLNLPQKLSSPTIFSKTGKSRRQVVT